MKIKTKENKNLRKVCVDRNISYIMLSADKYVKLV